MKLNISSKTLTVPVFTHEGSVAKKISKELELRRSVLATMLWEDSFYESGQTIAERIRSLIPDVKAEKVAALAVETRNQGKLRHVPLLLVREMARLETHKHLVADTLRKVIQRPDELCELVKIYWGNEKRPLSAQIKKGLAAAFTKFDEFSLSKYNRDAEIKLRDILFLCHAKPKDKDQEKVWKKLIGGFCAHCWVKESEHKKKKHPFEEAKLSTPDTWEVALSASQGDNKKEVWERLLSENKLGGLALLRNLRNFKETGVSETLIRQALGQMRVDRVLPYRFITAAKYVPNLEPELEQTMFKSIENKGPKIKGKTVLLIDVSGSMNGAISNKSESTRMDAACSLAILAREIFQDVEVCTFSNHAVQVPSRRGFALRDAIERSQPHMGTYLGNAISTISMNIHYERLIIFTDEQSHDKIPTPKLGSRGYVINVASYQNGVGYGPWIHIDGFSESVLDYIIELEKLNKEEI